MRIEKYHKVGFGILGAGVVVWASSLAFHGLVASVLIVLGLGLIAAGLMVLGQFSLLP